MGRAAHQHLDKRMRQTPSSRFEEASEELPEGIALQQLVQAFEAAAVASHETYTAPHGLEGFIPGHDRPHHALQAGIGRL